MGVGSLTRLALVASSVLAIHIVEKKTVQAVNVGKLENLEFFMMNKKAISSEPSDLSLL
jgi:hypothetical protein